MTNSIIKVYFTDKVYKYNLILWIKMKREINYLQRDSAFIKIDNFYKLNICISKIID